MDLHPVLSCCFTLYEKEIYHEVIKWNHNNGLAIGSILMFHLTRKEKIVKLMASCLVYLSRHLLYDKFELRVKTPLANQEIPT